jgi:hypothetical protein
MRLAYQSPTLEHLGSLVELTKTDTVPNDFSDGGSGYSPGQPGGS